ncbi:MAG TPA: outer membrane beta-barrel protein [Chryseosolibacter sp.]
MKKLLTLIFLFLSIWLTAAGQAGFRDGYVITLTNDSIKTQVEIGASHANYTVCTTKQNDVIKGYRPSEIKAYGVYGGRSFQSGILDDVFVEVLISGELAVYKYNSSFHIKKADRIFSPEEKEIEATRTDAAGNVIASGTVIDTRWKGQLASLINDCKISENTLRNIQLTERKLVALALEYNACRGETSVVHKSSEPWTRVALGLNVGITNTTLTPVSGASYEYEYFPDSYNSWNPTFGAFLSLSAPKIDGRLAFHIGANVTGASFNSYVVRNNPYDNVTEYTTRIRMTVLSFPISMHYEFTNGKFSPFVEAGFSYDRILSGHSDVTALVRRQAGIEREYRDALTFRKSQFGLGVGAGIVMNTLKKYRPSLTLNYYSTSQMNDDPALRVRGSRMAASIIVMKR